jgi:hypothetical protein
MCEIWGFHGDEDADDVRLSFDTMYTDWQVDANVSEMERRQHFT